MILHISFPLMCEAVGQLFWEGVFQDPVIRCNDELTFICFPAKTTV